jgi:hypothetical protein
VAYNETPGNNHLRLLPAFELYENRIYRDLVARFGVENCYVLSAGWGLINAAFLTPSYDITFSASGENYARRRKGDSYHDLCMLADNTRAPIIFFGGKEYVSLFVALTRSMKGRKKVFYNSAQPPAAPGCALARFSTRTRTNWQYECSRAFLNGDIQSD